MPERRHESPRDGVRPALLILSSLLFAAFAVGCDKIQIPDMGQQPAAPNPAGAGGTPPAGQALPGQGAAPVDQPLQSAKPDAKLVVAAFLEKAKQTGQLEDQDLLKVTELTEGLEDVTELKLIGAKITDKGVGTLSKFPKLAALDLSSSLVTNDGLTVIKDMPELQKLALASTKIDDKSMQLIGEKEGLKELSLTMTGVTDFGLSLLGDLKELEVLDISYTPITGKGFEKFKSNKHLRVLRGQHSSLQNEAMKYLAKCPIEELNLDVTGISDPGMMYIGKMSKLKKLSLEFCGVTDFGVKKMVIMKDLETISVRDNRAISGLLFEKLKTSKKLQFVNAAGTQINSTQCAMLMKLIPGCKASN